MQYLSEGGAGVQQIYKKKTVCPANIYYKKSSCPASINEKKSPYPAGKKMKIYGNMIFFN